MSKVSWNSLFKLSLALLVWWVALLLVLVAFHGPKGGF